MAFKRTLPGKGKPEPFSKVPSCVFCPKCLVKRYVAGGRCLHCGAKVAA